MLLQAPADWLKTHPPLPDRLHRLYGRGVEPMPAPVLAAGSVPDEAYRPMQPAPIAEAAPIAYAVPMADHPAPTPQPDAPNADQHVPRAVTAEEEREAIERLSRINGPGELRATILALLLTPGSQRERRAWRDETKGLSTADALRSEVKKLGPAVRLPWLEALLMRLSRAPLLDRQTLMESARRVMAADGQVRPIDRLHLLLMRQRLGEAQPVKPSTDAHNDMAQLSLHLLRQIAKLTAFLARLVPDGDAWYASVMQPWLKGEALPPCEAPDADGLVNALQDVQALPWMLKPVLVRAWLDAALAHKAPGALSPDAADALRLAAGLLDSPLPPELARHYVEPAVA